jgi:hypothetical protein
MRRGVRAVLAGLVLVAWATGAAHAADRCRQLQAELASIGRSAGSAKAERYRVSAEKQRATLKATERQARRMGCFGSAGGSADCRTYLTTIDRMRSNLASLERMSGGGVGASQARRAEIRAQLKEAGCRDATRAAQRQERPKKPVKQAAAPRKPARPKAPVQVAAVDPQVAEPPASAAGTPAGLTPLSKDPVPPAPPFDRSLLAKFSPAGSYRTICVRTCDGYFFPISWSARRDDFEADSAMCRSMCPGAPAELYVHETGTESDTAVSLAGMSYRDMPAAYRYRTVRDPACACEAAGAPMTPGLTDLFPPKPVPAPARPPVATTPPEDWQIPDADSSTVPRPDEASLRGGGTAITVAFDTRRFPDGGAVPDPAIITAPVRTVGPAWHPGR